MMWERQSRAERTEAMYEVQKVLRSHHRNQPGPQAHPQGGFQISSRNGSISSPGVAHPGNPPTWAL